MSFQTTQTDYFDLASTTMVCTSSDENRSAQVAQAKDEKGDVIVQEVYGETMAPACTYVLKSDTSTGTIKIGQQITKSGDTYTLTSLQIDTSAGAPPSVQASGEQVPSGTQDCYYTIPSATIKVCHHAQILWSAFTLSGAGCYLQSASYTASGSLTKAEKDGETIAYDISDGMLQASITVVQSGTTQPIITAGSGWIVSGPASCSNPDAEYPTWTCTLQKPLTHTTQASH